MPDNQRQDVLIIGGGLVGLTCAAACISLGLKTTIVESRPLFSGKQPGSDGRSSAIASGSYRFLKKLGVWKQLQNKAGPINDIRISDQNSTLFLHYSHTLTGDEPMGYMVANTDMWSALFNTIKNNKNLTLIDNKQWQDLTTDAYGAHATLNDGTTISASLLIACDGRFSKTREHFGIQTNGWNYAQTGIVCNVQHEKHNKGIAQERFLSAGPFAILPLHDGHHSSLVWTEKTHLAPTFTTMSEQEITTHIATRFGDYLGGISLASKVFSYPLSLLNAKQYTAKRLVLAGDAAHAIHPIAGQGFNLGIRDIEALYDALEKAQYLGLDIGSNAALENYTQLRSFDVHSLIAITDILNRLFSNDITPVKFARRIGMAGVEKMPKLKKLFMRHAMGMAQPK